MAPRMLAWTDQRKHAGPLLSRSLLPGLFCFILRIAVQPYSYYGDGVSIMTTNSAVSSSAEEVEGADMCQQRAVHPEHVLAVRHNLLPADLARQAAALFGLLSDPTRLQVVYALLHAPEGELCVCDLAAGLGRDDTTISHQLRVLRSQQLVTMRKVGRVVYYRLIDEHVSRMLALGLDHASEPQSAASHAAQEVSA